MQTVSQTGSWEALSVLVNIACRMDSSKVFREINRIAVTASQNSSLESDFNPVVLPADLLENCKKCGLLNYDSSKIQFVNEQARKWWHGFWLEEYVRFRLASLRSERLISTWSDSVITKGKNSTNELDALFTVNNRLYFIECKTGKLDANPVYKAFSLRENLGGSFAQFMICSIDSLPGRDKSRARDYGIETVTGSQLGDLRKLIIKWIK